MKKELLLAAVCILILPLWFSASQGYKITNSAPFGTIAYAGHTLGGDWCACATPGCLCYPGEEQTGHSAHPVSDASSVQANPKAKAGRPSELDYGTGAMMLVLALVVWARLRA